MFVLYYIYRPDITEDYSITNKMYDFGDEISIVDHTGENVPPFTTEIRRPESALSLQWNLERERTPDHLFLAQQNLKR